MIRTLLPLTLLLSFLNDAPVLAQSVNPEGVEVHPELETYICTRADGCQKQISYIVLDSSIHPTYQKDDPSIGCGEWGSPPNATVCPDAATCHENCIMDPISNYTAFGVQAEGSSLHLTMLGPDLSSISPRVYLLDTAGKAYNMLQLVGQELAFDVDVHKLPCGMNGALYLTEMSQDGGKNSFNEAGALLGHGYCSSQCFTSPFMDGVGNLEGRGACCNEMNIWEANRRANTFVPHPCNITSAYHCSGAECDFDGVCDKWGCSYNSYAVGNPNFYGEQPQAEIDTNRPFTVVTSFPAADDGVLKSIERKYIQDGRMISNAVVNVTGRAERDYLDDAFCAEVPDATRRYSELGGLVEMGNAMSRGMTLVFSVWWDYGDSMAFLDGSANGAGPCNATEGHPESIKLIQPDTAVTYSQVRWGEIGSTCQTENPNTNTY